jgi:hypothetical protein
MEPPEMDALRLEPPREEALLAKEARASDLSFSTLCSVLEKVCIYSHTSNTRL